jgi:hypothetical protein
MRDIRDDLRERLSEISKRRAELESQLAELDAAEVTTNSLLHREDERWAVAERNPSAAPLFVSSVPLQYEGNGKYSSPVAKFVLRTLAEQGPSDLPSLKRAARKAGIGFGEKSPGRSLHFLLTGMRQTGRVEKDGENWKLKGS